MTVAIPRYEMLKQHVLKMIEDGNLKPGDRLPSENQLVDQFDVSRMTANRALKELSSDGYIIRRAGLGTFVADARLTGEAIKVTSIKAEVEARGEAWSAEVLAQRTMKPTRALAEALEMDADEQVVHLTILHRANGLPIELEDRAIHPGIVPGCLDQDFTTQSTTDYLLDTAALMRAEHVVRAVMPSKSETSILELENDEACLLIERKSWSAGRVASIARLLYPSSRYELRSTFENPHQKRDD